MGCASARCWLSRPTNSGGLGLVMLACLALVILVGHVHGVIQKRLNRRAFDRRQLEIGTLNG